MNWMNILYVLVAALLIWFGYRTIRNSPELFSKENLSKSVRTLGGLAIILIIFITLLVMMLRHS